MNTHQPITVPQYDRRQSPREWRNAVEAMATLNGLNPANTLLYAVLMLPESLQTTWRALAANNTTMDHLQQHLEAARNADTTLLSSARRTLQTTRIDITKDLHKVKREVKRLFDTGAVQNNADKVDYLMRMLPPYLFNLMWPRNPQTVDAFFNDLQAHKELSGGAVMSNNFQYFPSITTEENNPHYTVWAQQLAQMNPQPNPALAQMSLGQLASLQQVAVPGNANAFQLTASPNTTVTDAAKTAVTRADVDALADQLKEVTIKIAQLSRPRPRREVPVHMQNVEMTCYNCRQPGHMARDCPEPRQPRRDQRSRQFQNDVHINTLDIWENSEEYYEEEDEYDPEEVTDEYYEMCAADRVGKVSKGARKGVSDGPKDNIQRVTRSMTAQNNQDQRSLFEQARDAGVRFQQPPVQTVNHPGQQPQSAKSLQPSQTRPGTKDKQPKYKMEIPVKARMKPYSIIDTVKQLEVPIKFDQLLGISNDTRKELVKYLSATRKPQPPINLATSERSNFTSLISPAMVEGTPVSTLVDTGAAISAVSLTLLNEMGYEVERSVTYKIRGVGNDKIIPIGEIEDFPVTFGKVTIPVTMAVIDTPQYPIILGNDWLSKAQAVISYRDPMEMEITWKGRRQRSPVEYSKLPSLYTDLEEEEEEEEGEIEEEEFEINVLGDWITRDDEKQLKKNHQKLRDMGLYQVGRPFDYMFQAIAGQYCKYCQERSEDHHAHWLVIEGGPNDNENAHPWYNPPKTIPTMKAPKQKDFFGAWESDGMSRSLSDASGCNACGKRKHICNTPKMAEKPAEVFSCLPLTRDSTDASTERSEPHHLQSQSSKKDQEEQEYIELPDLEDLSDSEGSSQDEEEESDENEEYPQTDGEPIRKLTNEEFIAILRTGLETTWKTEGQKFQLPVYMKAKPRGKLAKNIEAALEKLTFDERLSQDEQAEMQTVLQEYADVFALDMRDLGRTDLIQHQILTGEAPPHRTRVRPLPDATKHKVRKELERMEDAGIIVKSKSPYACGIVVVPKKNTDEVRVCTDARPINKHTPLDPYPMPKIEEILQSCGKAKWFSKLDAAKGYWQVPMDPRDQHKTAFITHCGHFEYTVMPFGLKNAPATYTRLMDAVLNGLLGKFVINYLDDAVIYSETWEEHLEHLKEVLYRFRSAGLRLNLEKCEFGYAEIKILGHRMNRDGILVDPNKVDQMMNIVPPTTVRQLQQALGLFGYYRRFIQHYARIAKPLYKLLRKEQEWEWTEEQHNAFETLKEKLISAPILMRPNYDQRFTLYTDGSYDGLGAILAQKDDQNREGIVSFASRTLSKPEKNYAATELECLAMVWGCEQFYQYIWGREFDIITDHQALVWLMNKNKQCTNRRIARWIVTMENLNFQVQYRPGKKIPHVDALSRIML